MEAQKIIALAASVLMLSACGAPAPKPTPPAPKAVAPQLNLNDAQDVAGASSVQRDDYAKTTTYRGPNLASKPQDQLFVQARKTDAGSITYQIFVKINYSGVWRFYNQAYDPEGNALYTTLLSRNLAQCQDNDCVHSERLSVDVTRNYLQEHLQSGLRFSMRGKADEEIFFIPSGYIKAFLSLAETSH